MHDCASRIKNRVQITTDGHKAYLEAVESAFGADVDYAQLHKIYGASVENETRYSPAVCIGCDMKAVSGNPNPKYVSTSYVERQNLTMRMHMRSLHGSQTDSPRSSTIMLTPWRFTSCIATLFAFTQH